MKEKQLENDAFVAYLSAPLALLKDYLLNGLTALNTQFLTPDEYKNTPGVKNLFTDKEGVFDNDKFNQIYKAAEAKYLELSDQEALENLLTWSPTSRYAPIGSKKETYNYTPQTGNNPTRRNKSITGLNLEGPEKYTEKELALMGKIWDSEKGLWKEGSAEGQSLWDKISGQTLVYAKYTQDGEQLNPVTGKMEFHKAGEWMKDEDGNYFTRTIKTEDLGTNEVVNLGDILTKEDSWLNKLDALDSDERKKSLPGVIAKTAILSIPWLIPVVNDYYAAISVATSLTALGATFAKAGEKALLGLNNSGFGRGATAVENWFKKFSVGVSEENALSFFSLENLGQQMADTFGQLHQQQAAAKLANIFYRSIPDELEMLKMSGEKIMAIWDQALKRNKLGGSLSLGYMGLVSAADVYNDALNSGYDERTAGLTALASAGALFGIMNFNETTRGIGNWFLKSATGYDHEITRTPVIKCAKNLYKDAEKALNTALKDHNYLPMNNFFGDMWANTKSWLQDNIVAQGEGVWKNMLVEGVEEVSEEAILDSVKGIVDTLSALGFTAKEGSFGGWDNVFSKEGLSRYVQTALGGAMGGGLFELQRTKLEPAVKSFFTGKRIEEKINDKDIVDLVLQGRAEELRKELINLKSIFNTKRGATGIVEEDGTIHDFKANGLLTQADMIVDETLARVNAIEKTIESIVPRTYFGSLSTMDERRFRENLLFNGIDLEPVFFADFTQAVNETIESWKEYRTKVKLNEDTKKKNEEDTSKPATDLVDEKGYKEDFEKKLKRTKSYFDPKLLAYRLVLGKVLTSGQIAYGLSGGYGAKKVLDIENWMKIFYPDIKKKYSELEDGKESDPKFLVTKRFINLQYEDFYKAWGNALKDPKDLAKRMRLMTELYMNASLMLEPIQRMTDLDHKVERMKVINEYKPAEIYQKYVDQLDLEGLFPKELEELQNLSDEDKELAIKKRREQLSAKILRDGQAEARNARLIHFAEIALKNPFAFSARERVNFDLAGALEKKGILKFSDDMDSSAKEIFKAYLNLIAQDSGLVVFNKETLEALQKQVIRSFHSSDNLFVKALALHIREYRGPSKIEDVEVTGEVDEEGSIRKALIDLVSPSLESWNLDLLDSDDFYDEKILAQIAYKKAYIAKEGDITGLTDPHEIIKVKKGALLEIVTDNQHRIEKLNITDYPAGINVSEFNALNLLAGSIFQNWETASFEESKEAVKEYYKLKYQMLSTITAAKTIELALLKGIEDLIGTDTIIDKRLLELLHISFAGEILPLLKLVIQTINKLLPADKQISSIEEALILENLDKIDFLKVDIPNVFTETGIINLLKIILPSLPEVEGDSLSVVNMKRLSKLIETIATKPNGRNIRLAFGDDRSLDKNLQKTLETASTNALLALLEYDILKKIVEDLINSNIDIEDYYNLESLLLDPYLELDEEEKADILNLMQELKTRTAEINDYLRESEILQSKDKARQEAFRLARKALESVDIAQEAKEQCLKFVNMFHDELLRYLKLVKNKTIIDTEDPVIDMLKQFYRIIHGNEGGETAIEKLSLFERAIRLSDVTGDSLSLSEDEKAGLDDIIETTSFISYIIDGAVKWGDVSLDTQGQNINEVWRNYELTFGDKEKAKKIIVLDAKDGITVLKYLADINLRARDLKALYGELNKSKSEKYEGYRILEVKSKIKFLKSDIIRKFHVFGGDDEEIDLLDGVTDELLNAPNTDETKLALELIVSTNLHKYYELKKSELKLTSEEEFEREWSKALINKLMQDTDYSNDNRKIEINDSDSRSALARLYLMTYSWDTVDYSGDYVRTISVPGVAIWITQLAKTSPKYRYDLLSEVYAEEKISPRIDLENAILAIDFAVGNPSLCNALEEAIVEARKSADPNYSGGPAFKNVYTLFGTGGSGKTLLMLMLSKHYGDSKAIHFSATLQEKVDDLIAASEAFGKKRDGKKLSDYFSKMTEYDSTFETTLIAAIEHINEKLYGNKDAFIADTTLVDGTIGTDISITYKDDSLTADKNKATFVVKTPNIEFEVIIILPLTTEALVTVDTIYVDPSKVTTDIVADDSLKDSILFMDEVTLISPFLWAVLLKLAAEKNFVVIGAGDPVLKGWETKKAPKKEHDKYLGKIIQSMEKYNILTLGNLFGAWRADNTSLQETVNHLYEGLYKYLIQLDNGDAFYVEGSPIAPKQRSWKDALSDLKKSYYHFTYTLSSGIEDFPFLGTYMPLSDDSKLQVFEAINNSKATSKVIIVDDGTDTSAVKSSLPELLKDDSWKILTLSEVLGKEFDYAVLWKLSGNANRLLSSRELFTALTRAKKGLVIILKDITSSGIRDIDDLFDIWQIDSSTIKLSSNIKPYGSENRDSYALNRALEILTLAESTQEIETILTTEPEDDDEKGDEHKEIAEDEHGVDEHASETVKTEAEEESGLSAEGFSSTLSGSKEADSRNKAISATWSTALGKAGHPGTPVGIGDWYTRLGISASYIYGLESGESYYNPKGKDLNNPVINKEQTLSDWEKDVDFNKARADEEYVDLYGFIKLLLATSLATSGAEWKILTDFKTIMGINSAGKFKLGLLINLFESFKIYVYERSSEFLNIFYKLREFDEDCDYSFRKINDDNEIRPYFSTGIVFVLSDSTPIYITTGAVNKDAITTATDKDGNRINIGKDSYAEGVLHKEPLPSAEVNKIIQAVEVATGKQSSIHSMSQKGGVYQVTSGVNLRFGTLYRLMNSRFGTFDYDRVGLDTLDSLNYEILSYDQIELLANARQIPTDVAKLFRDGKGLYKPITTDPDGAKKAFKLLTESFRWAGLDPSNESAYMNFYNDRWILIRKKGLTIPTLTRVSYVPGGYNLSLDPDLKHFTGNGKNGRSKLLSKYKHKQLINAFVYQACLADGTLDFYDSIKSFGISTTDLIAKKAEDIRMATTSLLDSDLFTPELLAKIDAYKTLILDKIKLLPAFKTNNDALGAFEKLLDSYIARMKWNAIWIQYGDELKINKKYYKPRLLDLLKYLGAGTVNEGLRKLIIDSNNYNKGWNMHDPTLTGLKPLLDIINDPTSPLYNYFYENATRHIETMSDILSGVKRPNIVVEYVNEGTRSFVNTSEYLPGQQIGRPSTGGPSGRVISNIESDVKNLLNYLLDKVFNSEDLPGFYNRTTKAEFKENAIKKLVRLYTGKKDLDTLSEDEWKKVIIKFLGADGSDFTDNNSIWTLLDQLKKWKLDGSTKDTLPDFIKLFVDVKNMDTELRSWNLYYADNWGQEDNEHAVILLFKDFLENCANIKDTWTKDLLLYLFTSEKVVIPKLECTKNLFAQRFKNWAGENFIVIDKANIGCK